jgi:integrase
MMLSTFPARMKTCFTFKRIGIIFPLNSNAPCVNRAKNLRDDLTLLCERAGIPYLSPHKFRHGHVVYARQFARTLEEMKAISQNVMHANMIVTDGIYGELVNNTVKNTIARLGQVPAGDGLEAKLDELLRLLQSQR